MLGFLCCCICSSISIRLNTITVSRAYDGAWLSCSTSPISLFLPFLAITYHASRKPLDSQKYLNDINTVYSIYPDVLFFFFFPVCSTKWRRSPFQRNLIFKTLSTKFGGGRCYVQKVVLIDKQLAETLQLLCQTKAPWLPGSVILVLFAWDVLQ